MRIQKRNNPYTPLRFSEVGLSAQYLADIIETRLKDLTNILLKYESHEVVQDEVARTLDLLKHLKENKKYFEVAEPENLLRPVKEKENLIRL